MVAMHGTFAASHWSLTGLTVSGVEVASTRSTWSWVISSPATCAARALLDCVSFSTISIAYFVLPTVMPSLTALRMTPST